MSVCCFIRRGLPHCTTCMLPEASWKLPSNHGNEASSRLRKKENSSKFDNDVCRKRSSSVFYREECSRRYYFNVLPGFFSKQGLRRPLETATATTASVSSSDTTDTGITSSDSEAFQSEDSAAASLNLKSRNSSAKYLILANGMYFNFPKISLTTFCQFFTAVECKAPELLDSQAPELRRLLKQIKLRNKCKQRSAFKLMDRRNYVVCIPFGIAADLLAVLCRWASAFRLLSSAQQKIFW